MLNPNQSANRLAETNFAPDYSSIRSNFYSRISVETRFILMRPGFSFRNLLEREKEREREIENEKIACGKLIRSKRWISTKAELLKIYTFLNIHARESGLRSIVSRVQYETPFPSTLTEGATVSCIHRIGSMVWLVHESNQAFSTSQLR